MATSIWSKRDGNTTTNNRSAPCTIFSTTALSPRQIANKAYSLGCKKLDRDDKRSKQRYHMRERLLLVNTIAKAEEVLKARTRRTNRRVMAAEDEEEHSTDEFSKKHHVNNKEHHSPLRSSASEEEEEEQEKESQIPNNNNSSHHITSSTTTSSTHTNHTSLSSTTTSSTLLPPRDCRVTITNNSKTINAPIATTII